MILGDLGYFKQKPESLDWKVNTVIPGEEALVGTNLSEYDVSAEVRCRIIRSKHLY